MGSGIFDDWIEANTAPVMTAHNIVNYEHTMSLDLTTLGLVAGQMIGFKIIDQNIVAGPTEAEFDYEIA